MPGYSDTAARQALDALGGSLPGSPVNVLAFVSMHTADPGTTGASEAAGGSYAAQACSWNNAATRSKTNSSALTFSTDLDVLTHFATRNQAAASGATHGISGALGSSVSAATVTVAAGALTISA